MPIEIPKAIAIHSGVSTKGQPMVDASASEGKVLLQFLVEAVVLSAAGGLVGIALGVGGSFALAAANGWPFVLSPGWVLLAFGISMGIGVVFGFYPARKAARMNPIDALRFE